MIKIENFFICLELLKLSFAYLCVCYSFFFLLFILRGVSVELGAYIYVTPKKLLKQQKMPKNKNKTRYVFCAGYQFL